jgi:2-haloacid dehalogenase/putative hydrolase of the HAD superfamily
MPRIRALLLDFYGTLVRDDDEIMSAISEEIRIRTRVPATTAEVGRFWEDHFALICTPAHGESFITLREAARESLAATIVHFSSDAVAAGLIERQFSHWVAPPLFPESTEFLEHIQSLGIPCCIVSDIDRADIEAAINSHGLKVGHLVTSDDARSYKPRPEMFQRALSRLCCQPEEVLHVGNSRTTDIAGSRAMNIPVAWINRGGEPSCTGPAPNYTISNLLEILPLLGGADSRLPEG